MRTEREIHEYHQDFNTQVVTLIESTGLCKSRPRVLNGNIVMEGVDFRGEFMTTHPLDFTTRRHIAIMNRADYLTPEHVAFAATSRFLKTFFNLQGVIHAKID